MGIVEMSQGAMAAAHQAGQPEDRPEVELTSHRQRVDRKSFLRGFSKQRAFRLNDKKTGVTIPFELPDEEERLSLPAPPFFPGVNLEKAQSSLLFSRSL